MIDVDLVAARVDAIHARIDRLADRPVTLVAVTKGFGVEAAEAALAAGVVDLGENYAQELADKAERLIAAEPAPRWHMIGHVQRNKVKLIAPHVAVWQTVDSERLATTLASRAPGARVLVQVAMAGNEGQSGVVPSAAPALVEKLRNDGLEVAGLMMIGRAGDDELTAEMFRGLRAMADDLELEDCSMGMSGDLDLALAAGATIVRVGSAIFGPRPPR